MPKSLANPAVQQFVPSKDIVMLPTLQKNGAHWLCLCGVTHCARGRSFRGALRAEYRSH